MYTLAIYMLCDNRESVINTVSNIAIEKLLLL